MIRIFYSPDDEGGGDPPKKKEPPKGYKPTTAVQRRDWNDMLDKMQKDGVAGSKDLDQTDKNAGSSYIEKYRKENPGTSVTSDMIPYIQYEQQQLRSGESFGGMSPEQTRILRKQLSPEYLKRKAPDPGSSFNSDMSRSYYPEFKKGDKNYGTDAEGYIKDFSSKPPPGIKIKDTRAKDFITGSDIDDKKRLSYDVNPEVASKIISAARKSGIDPYTALAISYQETGINSKHPFNLNPDVYGTNFGDPEKGVESIHKQLQYAKSLQDKGTIHSGEDYYLQGYNGYGKIKKGHVDLEGSKSIYGLPIPEEGFDLKNNPLYGKRVMDIRDNILKKNPEIIKLVGENSPSTPEMPNKVIGHGPPDIGLDSDGNPAEGGKEGPNEKDEEDIIPRPNYNDTTSRGNYLKQWAKKYGDLQGRGDTVLKVNEIPRGASDTIKNISTKAAKEYGLDAALLYSSAMEEGASGLFKDKSGIDTKHRKPGDFGYQDFYGDKEFPVNGGQSFGLPDFANRFPELVSGGYLNKEFASRFRGKKNAGQYGENDFKTVEDGMKAKAAFMKFGKDYVDKYASEKGINLSKKAEDFFTLVFFNGGEGGVHKLLKRYNEEGLLKDDKFLKEHPHKDEKIDPKDDIWQHVTPRLKMAQNLKKEKHFDDGDTH